MDCSEFLQGYTDYDDSLLGPSELERFRDHLDGCEACARYDRVLRKGRMLARQAADVEPSPDFMPRLRSRIQTEAWGRRADREPAGRLAAALASLTVVLAASASLALFAPDAEGTRSTPVAGSWPTAAPSLPAAAGLPSLRGWGFARVDPALGATYSPLVTGPPAYRPADRRAMTPVSTH